MLRKPAQVRDGDRHRPLDRLARRAEAFAGAAMLILYLTGSALRRGAPRKAGLQARLFMLKRDGLPLRAPVTIHWNDHHVPFIEAAHDEDLAVALGVVHSHLRLAQIDLMRRIALGRLSELLGPVAAEPDHALRVLDFARAGDAMGKVLPPDTRAWLENFIAGVNWHAAHVETLPHEFAVLGVEPEPWSLRDLLAVSRLASMDFTWRVWLRLLKLRGRPNWAEAWSMLMREPIRHTPSLTGAPAGLAEALLNAFGRPGSNACAVAPARTAGGAPLIASDPHLPFTLPTHWLIAGIKSPGYHAVGLMVPGVPIIGLGRNPWIAWGGTSLHGASSELVNVATQPESAFHERRETIKVRWGRERTVEIRDSNFGPVISDARLLRMAPEKPVALHWLGHRPSDEVTPFLAVARAWSWDAFMAALDGYAIPALNMIYADASGHIGQAMAATLPRRPTTAPPDIVSDSDALEHWESFVTARGLPHSLDPQEGFVASANNAPPPMDISISLFFSPDDRVQRLREVLERGRGLTVADMARLQLDVVSAAALELRDRLLPLLKGGTDPARERRRHPLVAALRDWDGAYRVDSAGALAFELLVYHLIVELHGPEGARLYIAAWDPWAVLHRDLDRAPGDQLAKTVRDAAARAARTFAHLRTWGRAHRLRLAHAFGSLPLIGRRYRYADSAAAGSNETLLKTAHGFSGGRHRATFGANARHISDLADADANYFVLLGGQDGWLGSTTFADQVDLWRKGGHVRVPLRLETVRAEFPHRTVLTPASQRARKPERLHAEERPQAATGGAKPSDPSTHGPSSRGSG